METVTDTPVLLKIVEAAQYLGVSRSSIYRLIEEGTLKVLRPVPDAPRIARADLEAYVESIRAA